MNPFTSLSKRLRSRIYIAYGFATLAVSSVAAYCGAIGTDVPTWDVGIGAVLVPIGVLVSATAVSNVSGNAPEVGRHEG